MLLNFLKSAFAAPSCSDEIDAAAEALKQQGNECLARGELDAAVSCYREALCLEPDYAEALNNLGFVLKERGQLDEAEAALSRAIQLDPGLGNAHFNLGVVALRRGDPELAEARFERATRLMPENAEAYSYLANALHRQGKFDEATSALRKTLELDPDDVEARWVRAMTRIPVVPSERLDAHIVREELLAEIEALDRWFHPGRIGRGHLAVGSAQPFYLAYQEVSNKAVLERYGRLCKRLMDHWPDIDKFRASRLAPDGPIRIGIVTHMSNQSVWQPITRGWVQHLDRRRFEVCIFALDSGPAAEMDLARASAREVVEGNESLAEWVEAIPAQRIEVLIFPEIGMTTMTAKLANLRLAPIQVVAWGHPETSGLPTIDYFLSGECFEDAGADENYTEKLIRLPNLGVFVSPSNVRPPAVDLAALGLKDHGPILLCPGAPFKYAPEHDAVLVEIARHLPDCQLVFFAEAGKKVLVAKLKSRLQNAFERAGLDFGRHVLFVPFLDRAAFFGLMRRADVFLDTIGFSGFNTAQQAVECSLPIVTREGRFLRGRLASGILKRIGLPELVAKDEQEYVSLAVRLATDKQYREAIKKRLDASRHLLFDDVAPVRALEDFLERLCRPTADAGPTSFGPATPSVEPEHVWQLLSVESHMHTLKPGNAPVKLLEMVKPSPRKILDVGCFCGGSGRWLRERFPGCELVGIEKLHAAAKMAAEVYDKVIEKAIEEIDFEAEGIAVGTFDAIIAADVLEHLYNPWQALQRLSPLLAPGGALYISLPNVRNLGLLGALAKGEWKYSGAGLLDITHIRFFTRAQAIEMLEQTGWRIEDLVFNPDPSLAALLNGRTPAEIRSVSAGPLRMDRLSPGDSLELFTLQFHIRAIPGA